jgi:Flp pilus assembly protein TadG
MNVRGERGSAAIEAVMVIPAVMVLLLLVVAGGQVALARQSVQAVAADAARSASLQRTAAAARSAALTTAHAALDRQVLCSNRQVELNLAGFATPVGAPASVAATVSCQVTTLGLPGLPRVTVAATMTSPLDSYRARRP